MKGKAQGMSTFDWIVAALVIIGALNWGLVAIGYNLVSWILGVGTLARIVYGLVGLAGLYKLYLFAKK